MKTAIFLVSILAAANVRASEAPSSPHTAVAVRTYNYAGMALVQFAEAKRETEHIFQRAGIALEWIDCSLRAGDGKAACTGPLLSGHDLMLRLVDRTPGHGERIVPLGESMLDREQGGGVLMTVDLSPIRSVAASAATPVSTLLGRTVAHEMGHLLLSSAEHPRLGLMRSLWSRDELRGLKPAHWGFSARESSRMREKLRSKSRTAD